MTFPYRWSCIVAPLCYYGIRIFNSATETPLFDLEKRISQWNILRGELMRIRSNEGPSIEFNDRQRKRMIRIAAVALQYGSFAYPRSQGLPPTIILHAPISGAETGGRKKELRKLLKRAPYKSFSAAASAHYCASRVLQDLLEACPEIRYAGVELTADNNVISELQARIAGALEYMDELTSFMQECADADPEPLSCGDRLGKFRSILSELPDSGIWHHAPWKPQFDLGSAAADILEELTACEDLSF